MLETMTPLVISPRCCMQQSSHSAVFYNLLPEGRVNRSRMAKNLTFTIPNCIIAL